MKKFFLITIFFVFVCIFIYSNLYVTSGRNNLSKLKGAKPIYIILTFNGTLIYNEPMEQLLKNKKVNFWRMTKEELIKGYKKVITRFIGGRRKNKWGMQVINDFSQAKSGFIMVLNYDKDNPTPPTGAYGEATLTIYQVGHKQAIITCKIKDWMPRDWDIKLNFPNMGELFLNSIDYHFLNLIEKGRYKDIK